MKQIETARIAISRILFGDYQQVLPEDALTSKSAISFVGSDGRFSHTEYETNLDAEQIIRDLQRAQATLIGPMDKQHIYRMSLIDQDRQ